MSYVIDYDILASNSIYSYNATYSKCLDFIVSPLLYKTSPCIDIKKYISIQLYNKKQSDKENIDILELSFSIPSDISISDDTSDYNDTSDDIENISISCNNITNLVLSKTEELELSRAYDCSPRLIGSLKSYELENMSEKIETYYKYILDLGIEIYNNDTHTTYDHCPISCIEFTVGCEIKVLPCKHYFDPTSIQKWLKKAPTCPMCKYNISYNI